MLNTVANSFLCQDLEVASKVTEKIVTPKTADSEKHFFFGMGQDDLLIENSQTVEAALKFQKQEAINLEINEFSKIIANKDFKCLSSNQFWIEKKLEFPNLCTLFAMLNSINASSAYIERFFSLCGIITTQRNQNSREDLFVSRAMLCANMKILEKLKIND